MTINKTPTSYFVSVAALLMLSHISITFAHDASHVPSQLANQALLGSPLQVKGPLAPLPAGTTDMKFKDLFKMPVGAYGMEPSAKLLALQNQRVRIVGYMANQESFTPGLFILSPLPVHMGDDDDKFADDMPANSMFVHLDDASKVVHFMPGLIELTGVLSVGNRHEADGRVSFVRLTLDSALSSLLATQQPIALNPAVLNSTEVQSTAVQPAEIRKTSEQKISQQSIPQQQASQ